LNLKEQMVKDLDTFFNDDEMSDSIAVNGVEIDVVIDTEAMKERKMQKAGMFVSEGIGLKSSEIIFIARKDQLTEEPFEGQHMKFNGKPYRVAEVTEGSLIYTITIERYQT